MHNQNKSSINTHIIARDQRFSASIFSSKGTIYAESVACEVYYDRFCARNYHIWSKKIPLQIYTAAFHSWSTTMLLDNMLHNHKCKLKPPGGCFTTDIPLEKPPVGCNLQVGAYLLGQLSQNRTETNHVFNNAIGQSRPDDFFALKQALEPILDSLTLPKS